MRSSLMLAVKAETEYNSFKAYQGYVPAAKMPRLESQAASPSPFKMPDLPAMQKMSCDEGGRNCKFAVDDGSKGAASGNAPAPAFEMPKLPKLPFGGGGGEDASVEPTKKVPPSPPAPQP